MRRTSRTPHGTAADTADVVVVGAGICGNACAASAAIRGAQVVVVEKEDTWAREASGRAQGILRLQGRAAAEVPLAFEALELWRAAEGEADFELVFGGHLYLCDDEQEVAALEQLASEAHAAGLSQVQLLSADAAREVMPAAEGPFISAMWSPTDGHCQPEKATQLFAERARRHGVRHIFRTRALRILIEGDRVAGIVTDRGCIACRSVVLAAGIWTPYLAADVGMHVPIMPVVLSEGETSALPPLFEQSVRAFRFGCRQRPNGKIVFSAGLNASVKHYLRLASARNLRTWLPRYRSNRKGVKLRVDVGAISRELRHRKTFGGDLIPSGAPAPLPEVSAIDGAFRAMQTVIPKTRDARLDRRWAGVVDMSPDSLPIIDARDGPEGVVVISGLSGHGFALGPVIGEIAADLALTGKTHRPIDPFRLARFREERVVNPERVM